MNPPVEAPASRHRRPATSIPNASRAPMSLWAPRDTQPRSVSPMTFRARRGRDGGSRFDGGHPVDADLAGADQFRGLLARPGQPATDQLGINTGTPRHGGLRPSPPTPAPGPACRAPLKAGARALRDRLRRASSRGWLGSGSSARMASIRARISSGSVLMAPLLLTSLLAPADHRCSTLRDLRQRPPLQGRVCGVVAGFDGHGRCRPDGMGNGTDDRQAVAVVVL